MSKCKVGQYFYDVKDDIWTVRLMDTKVGDAYFDCKNQYEAEVLVTLIRIEIMLIKIGGFKIE